MIRRALNEWPKQVMFMGTQWNISEETALLNHHYQLGDVIERFVIILYTYDLKDSYKISNLKHFHCVLPYNAKNGWMSWIMRIFSCKQNELKEFKKAVINYSLSLFENPIVWKEHVMTHSWLYDCTNCTFIWITVLSQLM